MLDAKENEKFQTIMDTDGYMVFPSQIGEPMLERLRSDIQKAYEINRQIQKRNGVDYDGVAHHVIKSLWRGASFADYLENFPLKDYADAYFGAPFILNTMSGILNFPEQVTDVQHKPHRDMRTYFPVRLSLNMIVMVDDFTEENGATMIYKGTHLKEEMPSLEEFNANAKKMTGKAGDMLLYNSNVVHCAGFNRSNKVRRALAYTMVRPFMKSQCQYHTLVTDSDSDWIKQLLGYNARTARDLNEWYQPIERRMYRTGQG